MPRNAVKSISANGGFKINFSSQRNCLRHPLTLPLPSSCMKFHSRFYLLFCECEQNVCVIFIAFSNHCQWAYLGCPFQFVMHTWHLMQSIHFHVFIQSIVLNANVKNAAHSVCIGFAGNVCAMCLCIVIVAMFTITMYNFR